MQIDIGIPEETRRETVEGLSRLLADTYALYLETHGFHWNVTGPMFQTLHTMFMTQYTELWQALDVIAERIRALGEYAPANGAELARLSRIEQATGVPDALDMVRRLVAGHEAVIRTARDVFVVAERGHDQVTADVVTQRLDVHEKTAWMLRSLLA